MATIEERLDALEAENERFDKEFAKADIAMAEASDEVRGATNLIQRQRDQLGNAEIVLQYVLKQRDELLRAAKMAFSYVKQPSISLYKRPKVLSELEHAIAKIKE